MAARRAMYPSVRARDGFRIFAVSSILAATLGVWCGPGRMLVFAYRNDVPSAETISGCIWLAWLWLATVAAALAIYRWRAVWLLIPAPFVLFWPVLFIVNANECSLFGCW